MLLNCHSASLHGLFLWTSIPTSSPPTSLDSPPFPRVWVFCFLFSSYYEFHLFWSHCLRVPVWEIEHIVTRCVYEKERIRDHGVISSLLFLNVFFYPHWSTCLLIWESERGGERNTDERETQISCFPHAPWPRIKPAT